MSEESQSSFVAPACILERVRNTNQIYNQIVKLLPNQQGAVVNGNKITVQFPVDSILIYDLYHLMHIFKRVTMVINLVMLLIIMFKHTIYLAME